MANSKRKCRHCGEYSKDFIVINNAAFCDMEHAVKYASGRKDKGRAALISEQRREDRKTKERLKTRSDWLKEAQTAFNRYIRLRDSGRSCISCGKSTGAKMNAGHYLSVGAHPELRFNENNVHAQCEWCNSYLSGNQAKYRIGLIKKIGIDAVNELEGPHDPPKLSIEEIKDIKAKYISLAKELEKNMHNL